MARPLNPNGVALTKHCEGLVLMVYRDPVSIPTAGWGHLIRPADGDLHIGDLITQEQADRWLEDDLAHAAAGVDRYAPDLPSDNARGALTDFCFNLGVSNLRRLVDDADGVPARIAENLQHWARAGNTHPRGLRIRRALERLLFETPDDVPLPSNWLTSMDHVGEATP